MHATLHELLCDYRNGVPGTLDKILPVVYDDLRRIARRQVNRWRELTLDTSGVVHETYLKLARQNALDARDRAHFMAICSAAMRQFIVDYARKRLAEKRGANLIVASIDSLELPVYAEAEQLIVIDQTLVHLAAVDARIVRVFECRFFAGYTEEETAEALELSLRTVQRDWMRARLLVRNLLNSSDR